MKYYLLLVVLLLVSSFSLGAITPEETLHQNLMRLQYLSTEDWTEYQLTKASLLNVTKRLEDLQKTSATDLLNFQMILKAQDTEISELETELLNAKSSSTKALDYSKKLERTNKIYKTGFWVVVGALGVTLVISLATGG